MLIAKSSFWRAGWHIILTLAVLLPGIPLPDKPMAYPAQPSAVEATPATENNSVNFTTSPIELTYTTIPTVPQYLPYSLGYAVEVAAVGAAATAAVIKVALPESAMPEDALTQSLVRLFYYHPASETWRKLPTQRTREDNVWYLQAPVTEPGVYAAALATTPDYGDYQQPWQPTVTNAQVDLFTGAVQWSHPLEIPGGRQGLTPQLALTYNSGVVDSLHSTQNPQAAWVGMGWNLDVGYIAREIDLDDNYVPRCVEDYTLVLNGVSSKLIPIGGNQYRLEDERFWRIERRTAANRGGDDWLVTTPDGVQYQFGSQDETAGGDSRESAWWMVTSGCDGSANFRYTNWRWNLDQIADPRGNVARIDYQRETNDFVFLWPGHAHIYSAAPLTWCAGAYECQCALAGQVRTCHNYMAGDTHPSGYTRGGNLEQITYSWPGATHKVAFGLTTRDDYVPEFDSQVAIQTAQTFWSKQRLHTLEVRSVDQGQVVRRYELATSRIGEALVLDQIQEVAPDGARLPATTFEYYAAPDSTPLLPGYCTQVQDGHCATPPPGESYEGGYKPWLKRIHNGYGGSTRFEYTAPENHEQVWAQWQNGQTLNPHADAEGRYWYRYRVREVKTDQGIANTLRTVYEYHTLNGTPDAGDWLMTDDQGDGDPANDLYEFRGHPRVRVKQRDASGAVVAYSDHDFFQGLPNAHPLITAQACGYTLTDAEGLQGRAYRVTQHDAAGNELARAETAYLYRHDFGDARYFIGTQATCSYPAGAAGPRSQTDYQYDDYGNIAQEIHHGDTANAGDEVVVTRAYAYNPTTWIVNTPWQEMLQDVHGIPQRQTFYAYDGQAEGVAPTQGQVTQVRQGLGSVWTTAQTQYDTWGNPEIITDALDHATYTTYDPISHQFPVAVTNPAGHTTTAQWDLRLGVPEIITDSNGAATHLDYDSFGRVTAVTPPGDAFPSVKYTYPTGAALTAPFVVTAETRIDAYLPTPQYQTAWTVYDGLGRVIQTQTEAENGWLVLQSTGYDALGRPVTATLPSTVSASGGLYHSPDWDTLPKTVTTYDALGRVVQVQAADGSVTRQDYRAWQELVLDAEGHQTVYENDGLGRLTTVREYYGTYSAPDWNAANPARTQYTYDPQGNLTQVTDALGHVTRIGYDPLGRKIWMDDPSMGYWTYRYDAAGNLIEQTDAENQTLTFEYDALNRLTHKRHAGELLAEYGYDQGVNGIGRRTVMTDTSGVTAWQYDVQGRTLAESKTIAGAGTFATAWAYDAAGRVLTTTYPTGEAVRTIYNLRGLPETVAGLDAYLTGATYNAAGQPLRQTWGNARQIHYTYELNTLRLQRLQVSGNLLDLAYTYDKVGNIRTLTDASNTGQVQTFTYDARDRLLTAQTTAVGQGQYHETYGYDLMGNIITRTVGGEAIDYTYGRRHGLTLTEPTIPATNTYQIYLPLVARNFDANLVQQPFAVVATSAGFRAGYDRNGNMLVRVEVSDTETITYTQEWNVENRLSVVTNTVTGDVTRFVYDGDGNRALREDANGLTVYIGAVEVAISGTQRLTKTYYFVGAQRIAMRDGNGLTYLHTDHLSSASLATDASGDQLSEMRYTPFGETRHGTSPTDFRFTGQREESFGLYDYGARLYSPVVGRFIRADTIVPEIGNPQALNRYTYVENNPLKFIDPYGFEKVIILYGHYDDTDSYYAAAYTQYQQALASGYSAEDILFIEAGISTDTEILEAIRQSGVAEIEYFYYFGHGWGDNTCDTCLGGGLQLYHGPNWDEDQRQFTAGDLDATLFDRFADNAEFHINACQVADSPFPQQIADTFGVTTYASELSMKFWYQQRRETRQWWFLKWNVWVNVAPGESAANSETRWRQFEGANGYNEDLRVEMKPYTGHGPFSKFVESAYQRFDPSP
ncbi:MAG TPA: RHS repeat-associated core domain-containing protein [Anaerolineae bacterium]|nr:RHS repeat-associated core domain-containing protein [Anaerolineae bacterium]